MDAQPPTARSVLAQPHIQVIQGDGGSTTTSWPPQANLLSIISSWVERRQGLKVRSSPYLIPPRYNYKGIMERSWIAHRWISSHRFYSSRPYASHSSSRQHAMPTSTLSPPSIREFLLIHSEELMRWLHTMSSHLYQNLKSVYTVVSIFEGEFEGDKLWI